MSQTNEASGRAPVARLDWTQRIIAIAAAAGVIFASITLFFTYSSFRESQQAEVTDWYSAAITDLGSSSTDARVGGIYLLQQVMDAAPAKQPVVIEILTTFIRDHAPLPRNPIQQQASLRGLPIYRPAADVQAALTVLASRNPAYDNGAVIDLNLTNLTGANLPSANFSGVCLVGAILSGANLQSATLNGADLFKADADGANLLQADLSDADLDNSILLSANTFDDVANPVQNTETNLTGAELWQANLTGADFASANFTGSNLVQAVLRNAYLTGADFNSAYVRQAYFGGTVGKNLSKANAASNKPPGAPKLCGIN
jgi:uncharacterized protein YjbI with pentapeptide repeats